MKIKLVIEYEGNVSGQTLGHRINECTKVVSIHQYDENGKQIIPIHNHEFQDLLDDMNDKQIYETTIEQYGDLDSQSLTERE